MSVALVMEYAGIPQSSGSDPNSRQTISANGDIPVRGTQCRRRAVCIGVPLFFCFLLVVVARFSIFNDNDDAPVDVVVEKSKPPLRFVLIPLAGLSNKLRSIGKMYGFAESLGPSEREREMYVNWNMPGNILWNDVFSTPAEDEWGYKEVKYGLTAANTEGGPAPDIGRLCIWAGEVGQWGFRVVETYFNVSGAKILNDGKSWDGITYDTVADCNTVVLASAWGFSDTKRGQQYESRLLSELDVAEPVRPRLQALQTKMTSGAKPLGLHLRETDIPKESRVELGDVLTDLHRVMVKEPKSTMIYVSSDTAEGLSLVQRAYPARVVSQVNATRDRNSLDGLRCAAIDLLMLAFCDEVICTSHVSSFSQMAKMIHNTRGGGQESVEYFDEFDSSTA